MSKQNRWQDWVTLILGLWLFFSPFFMTGGALGDAAAWNAYLLGGARGVDAGGAVPAGREVANPHGDRGGS